MRKLSKAYERLGQLAGSREEMIQAGLDPDSTSFTQVCRYLGVCPGDMEELLLADTGLSGDELF